MITLTPPRSLTVLLALALAAAAAGGCTKAARTNRAIDRADQLFQAGEYSRAEAAYSNALRIVYPPNPKALRQLGLVYAQEGRLPAARSCLRESVKTEPDNARVQIELAEICAQLHSPVEAKEAARRALKLQPGNEKALVAWCYSIQDGEEAEQTRRYIQQLQKQDQDRASYHLAFGIIDTLESNLVSAESEFNTAKRLDPKSSMVYVGLARLSDLHHNPKGEDESFKAAVELAPLRSETRIQYAIFQARNGATNQARESMLELVRKAPNYLPPLLFLMDLSSDSGKFDECETYISQILDLDPGNYMALMKKGDVSLARKDGKQAVSDFQRLSATYPRDVNPLVPSQLAQAYLLDGNPAKALSSMNRSLQLSATVSVGDIKKLPAMIDQWSGRSNAVSAFLWSSLSNKDQIVLTNYQPSASSIDQPLAVVVQALNMVIGGPSIYESKRFQGISLRPETAELVKQAPTGPSVARLNRLLLEDAYPVELSKANFVPAVINLSKLNMRLANPAAAIALLTPLLKQTNQPVIVAASVILAQAYLLQKSPDQALALYRGLEPSFPNDPQLAYDEGVAWMLANKPAEARAAFEKSLAALPDFLLSVDKLVDLDLAESNSAPALKLVQKQIDKNPKAPIPWLLQARIHKWQKEYVQAQAELEKVIALDPKQTAAYLMLATVYQDLNQQRQALDKFKALVSLDTNNVYALMEIGMIHEQLKEYEPARQAYERLLAVDPQSASALNNLAGLCAERLNNLDLAFQLAEKGRQISPQDPLLADTLGWILYKRHEYPRALALLQESADKQSNSGEVHYHLGMAHYMLGQEQSALLNLKFALSKMDFDATNEALRHLKTLDLDPKSASAADRADLEKQLEKDSADTIALVRLAAIQERDGEFEKAAATYANLIKLNPEDARAIIRLAVLDSTKLNQAQKGLELAKNAHNLLPDDPYITETLGRMVFQARDFRYALSLLQAAASLLPAQPDLLHNLAWAYFSVGNVAEARASMQSALQTGAPFDKLNDARQFLDMTAVYSDPAQAQAAARVQPVLRADTNYAPALMAWGLIQQQQSQGKEAEQCYEKVLAAYPLFVPAVRQLSFLYARDGDNDKAYEYAMKATQAFPNDADLALLVGQIEYCRKHYAQSLQSLNRSALTKTNDAELIWYQGMDYYELKKNPEARTALDRAVALKLPPNLDSEARRVLGLLK